MEPAPPIHPLTFPLPQERRRLEIEERLQKEAELEREEATQERRGLYRHRREQMSRLARIQRQMAAAEMVREAEMCSCWC